MKLNTLYVNQLTEQIIYDNNSNTYWVLFFIINKRQIDILFLYIFYFFVFFICNTIFSYIIVNFV